MRNLAAGVTAWMMVGGPVVSAIQGGCLDRGVIVMGDSSWNPAECGENIGRVLDAPEDHPVSVGRAGIALMAVDFIPGKDATDERGGMEGKGGGDAEPGELRQGRVFTPEEGKEDLAKRSAEYSNREEWEEKAAKIRRGILEGAELWPLPEKSDLSPVRHSAKKMNGYLVENVAIESLPGLFVTGNLYLPDERRDMPIVLCPHGHWQGDDLLMHGRFREDMQKRCAVLAQMGCAVFAFDGVGFGESMQLGWEHKFDARVLKMQLWNAIRVLDFMTTLEGADDSRVLVTGASGGGTLTMQLAAVDDRVSMSVPCAMVSSYFYGGCDCESGMAVHVRPGHVTNPVEIAAVIAPKPMLVISDGGDWTAHTPDDVFPHLRRIYGFFGQRDKVENAHFPDGKHDFGEDKREALYDFVGRMWNLDADRVDESVVEIIEGNALRVFDDRHPVPLRALKPNVVPDFGNETP